MGNCLEVGMEASRGDQLTLEGLNSGGGGLKKLERCRAVRVEDVLRISFPFPDQRPILRMRGEEEEKKKVRRVTFCDEVSVFSGDTEAKRVLDYSGAGAGEEAGVLRVKIVLTKGEAAKLATRSLADGPTLRELLAERGGAPVCPPPPTIPLAPLSEL